MIRLISSLEKGTAYYFGNHTFLLKMTLFVTIILLELAPMMTFVRWRKAARHGEVPDTTRAPALARTSVIQAALIVAMVFAATAMARGLGAS